MSSFQCAWYCEGPAVRLCPCEQSLWQDCEVVLSPGKIWGRPYNSWQLLPSILLPIHCSHSIPITRIWPMFTEYSHYMTYATEKFSGAQILGTRSPWWLNFGWWYLIFENHTHYRGPGSVVGIATSYGLDGPEIESRWGARFSAPVQTSPGDHPASCTMGTGSSVKSSQGVTLTPHPLLVLWSWKGRAIPLLPLWAVWPVQSLSALYL
jgi:hypothetical protein